jgi:hypothetical protein
MNQNFGEIKTVKCSNEGGTGYLINHLDII